ncbi:MAG: crossover junction endodeoxyribonuclease RuvC [Clostridia bacterium]|nr:crossover junction endodeoxyribonuclease RuvC [Clostridia bacterium]
MVILGIDPGLAIVGWGVLEYVKGNFYVRGYGSIQTKAGLPVEERISQIYDGMNTIIDKYKPEVMAIEELFWNTNQKTGITVAEARGTILLAAHQKGLKINEYTPLQVKQAVVGYGRADKKQVITMVTSILNLPKPPKPDDTADALAIAICQGHAGASPLSKFYKM